MFLISVSFYPPPKQQPSTSFVSFISRFFSVNSIKWTEIVLLNYQNLQQPPETSTEGANNLIRNKKQHAMNTQRHCELLSCAYVSILHLRLDAIPSLCLGLHEPCPPIPCTTQPIPLCFTATFPASTAGEPDR